jgi:hypothetical protein
MRRFAALAIAPVLCIFTAATAIAIVAAVTAIACPS